MVCAGGPGALQERAPDWLVNGQNFQAINSPLQMEVQSIRSLFRGHTRFQVASDLHLETRGEYTTFQIPPTAPYLILAGDIGRLSDYPRYLEFLRSQCNQFVKVFLVLGNHEFYGISRNDGLEYAESLERELEGKLVILNRTRFDMETGPKITILGCTLQSHIPAKDHLIVEERVKDFRRIKDWTVHEHNTEHDRDVRWLQKEIALIRHEDNGIHRQIIVITHHAPSKQETSKPSDTNTQWSSAFATDLFAGEASSTLFKVQWWIYGHTHYTTQFSKGKVKFVSNQRGQPVFESDPCHQRPSSALHRIRRSLENFYRGRRINFNASKTIKV